MEFDEEDTALTATANRDGVETLSGRDTASHRETTAAGAEERRRCASLFSRCLAARSSANTAVSKFLELKVDGDSRGSAGPSAAAAGGRGKGGGKAGAWSGSSMRGSGGSWLGSGLTAAAAPKKPRLQIRLGDARNRE